MKPRLSRKWTLACVLTLPVAAALLTVSPLTSTGRRLRAMPLDLLRQPAQATVVEPSAAAYHPNRGTVLVASDEGLIVELSLSGAELARYELAGDLEGLAVHPETGLLYAAFEQDPRILEFDLDVGEVLRQWCVEAPELAPRDPNRQIEGLAIAPGPNGSPALLIAWEARPALVARLDADLTPARSFPADNTNDFNLPTRIASSFAPGPPQLSGLSYDPPTGLLLVLSAQDRTITACTPEGAIRARYRLDISKPEGICLLPDGDAVICQEDKDTIWFYRGFRGLLASDSD
ncbi:MAG: SdiA-regulated domain-containing protein [Phycisphaerales bacterium]|nr:MAG: SdiA-regulated domain-containing protein [Phycisphaerales bacterium]